MKLPALFYRRVCGLLLALLLLGFGASPEVRTSAADEPASKADQEAALQAAKSLYDGIIHKQLGNKLRVYLKPVPNSPIVTVMVAYKVGSADEDLDYTGLSHYLEHLMFKGTSAAGFALTKETFGQYKERVALMRWQVDNGKLPKEALAELIPDPVLQKLQPLTDQQFPTEKAFLNALQQRLTGAELVQHKSKLLVWAANSKIKPGDIDRLTLRRGGANNAYTGEDHTVYHFDFAAEHWEQALEVEADRMRNLRIDEKHQFGQEKEVVIQELERNEDTPWDLEYKAILPLLFGKKSPYGHPVIGESEHVRKASAEVIKAHYDRWYHPNNASLVICGGFDPDKALTRIEALFGRIPEGKLPERKKAVAEKTIRPERQVIASKFKVQRMLMGFNTIENKHPDYHALELVQTLLTGGKTGRLYKELVDGNPPMASAVSSSNSAGRYPGWFSIQVELLQGMDRNTAEEVVVKQLERLRKEPLGEAELKRIKQNVMTDVIFGRESVHSLADSIARGVTTNDLDHLRNYLPNIMKVTPADIQKAAQKYFDTSQRVVIWSVPGQARGAMPSHGGGARAEIGPGNRSITSPQAALRSQHRTRQEAGSISGGEFSLKNAKRFTLPNGLTLWLFENHRLPIVVADVSVRNVSLSEPEDKVGLATLTGYMLDEGTTKHPKGAAIAELIENVGGAMSLSASGGTVKVLSSHRKLGLELLFECLSQSTFPAEAFKKKQERLINQIKETEAQPDARAEMEYRKMVYGSHPFGRPPLGRADVVARLTREDCADFHRKVFVPNNTIVAIVGDFDSAKLIDEVKALTANWQKNADLARPKAPEVMKPKEPSQKLLTMPDAAQLHFYMGHVGIRRNNPDYYKLLVMDYILGTGPGFTDRLSSRLRDKGEVPAYSVSANITSSSTEEPGMFTFAIGSYPEFLARIKGTFLEEVKRIRDEKPKPEEVEDVKKYLLGSLPFQFTSNDRIASWLISLERFELGVNYIENYKKAVQAVTPEDVQAVARKYLDPEHMVMVAVGAIDDKGKPLPPPPEQGGIPPVPSGQK